MAEKLEAFQKMQRLAFFNSLSPLKVYQLKFILDEWEKEGNVFKGKKLSKKADYINAIIDSGINARKYKLPQTDPKPKGVFSVLKKFGLKGYTDEQQAEYLDNLKKNERFRNPLKALAEYINKQGKLQFTELQPHQVNFIKQFVFSNLQGSIAFHGVGSGKTLTAVVSSYYYLKMYPTHKVLVLSPPSLVYNFANSMVQYGLNVADKRYTFLSYEKFIRKPFTCENTLVIVDEAHNFRTEIKTYDTDEGTIILQNKRGVKLIEYASDTAHKILLLTGTPFVNRIYDIENELAMVDKRKPLPSLTFTQNVLGNTLNAKDYFNYRISYYKTSNEAGNFPDVKMEMVYCYMSEEEKEEYDEIKMTGNPKNKDSEKPNAFYSAERYASNIVGEDGENPKAKKLKELLRAKPKQKFIIYSALQGAGIATIKTVLNELKRGFKVISGKESAGAKEEAKRYFNGYNFDDDAFFDINAVEPSSQKYINNEFSVLLITNAGATGVDTINCENLIMYDGAWNDATAEQITARAVRFQSHITMPKDRRIVHVYRLLLVSEEDRRIIKRISKPHFDDWNAVSSDMKIQNKIAMQLDLIDNDEYRPTLKTLKELTLPDGSPFIEPRQVTGKRRGAIGQKSTTFVAKDGWDDYAELKDDDERSEWLKTMLAKYIASYGKKDFANILKRQRGIEIEEEDADDEKNIGNARTTSDLRMFILSKSKQKNINDFVETIGVANGIEVFEKYQSKLLPYIIEKEKQLKRPLTDEEQAEIYADALSKEDITVLNKDYGEVSSPPNPQRTDEAQKQQYYTNDLLAEALLEYTDIKHDERKLKVLEPTAGRGALIKPLLKLRQDITIDMVEIDRDNRQILSEMEKDAPNTLFLQAEGNFLKYLPSIRYDYIFMNPPFHLRSSENPRLLKDVWDVDFVKRAYAMLKVGGTLVAITSKHFETSEESEAFYKNEMTASHAILKGQKFGSVKIDVAIIVCEKKDDANDNEILGQQFFRKTEEEKLIPVMIDEGTISYKEGIKELEKKAPVEVKRTIKRKKEIIAPVEPPIEKLKRLERLKTDVEAVLNKKKVDEQATATARAEMDLLRMKRAEKEKARAEAEAEKEKAKAEAEKARAEAEAEAEKLKKLPVNEVKRLQVLIDKKQIEVKEQEKIINPKIRKMGEEAEKIVKEKRGKVTQATFDTQLKKLKASDKEYIEMKKDLDKLVEEGNELVKQYQDARDKEPVYTVYKKKKGALGLGKGNSGDSGDNGGKIAVKDLKRFIDNAQNRKERNGKKEQDISGFKLDPDLTTDESVVYYHPQKKHVVHSIRATNGTVKDWINNGVYLASPEAYKKLPRFKNAVDTQKKVEAKYKDAKKSIVTHSQSGIMGRYMAKDRPDIEIIQLNPASSWKDRDVNDDDKNVFTVKSTKDLVSAFHKNKPQDTIIQGDNYNQEKQHDIGLLDKLDQNKEIGFGKGKPFKHKYKKYIL